MDHEGMFADKEQVLTFHPAASRCILQYHKFFSSPGREGVSEDLYEQRTPALPGTQIRSLWPVAQTRTRPPPAPPPPQSNPSASLRAERCPLLTSDLFRALSCPD